MRVSSVSCLTELGSFQQALTELYCFYQPSKEKSRYGKSEKLAFDCKMCETDSTYSDSYYYRIIFI